MVVEQGKMAEEAKVVEELACGQVVHRPDPELLGLAQSGRCQKAASRRDRSERQKLMKPGHRLCEKEWSIGRQHAGRYGR